MLLSGEKMKLHVPEADRMIPTPLLADLNCYDLNTEDLYPSVRSPVDQTLNITKTDLAEEDDDEEMLEQLNAVDAADQS